MNKPVLGGPDKGFSYYAASHQYVLGDAKPIEFSRAEEYLLWRYFLGMRVVHMFERICAKPVSLMADPLRGCQLQCSYCYSEVWNDDGVRVSPERFAELQRLFGFPSLSMYGGDPFYDWKYTKSCIEAINAVKPLDELLISTNGIGVTTDKVAWLKLHVPKIQFQLSTEPESWGARKSANGKHQREILGDRLHDVSKLLPIQIALAIPRTGLSKWETLDETIDYFQRVVGPTDNWSLNWKLEENDEPEPTYSKASLPPWYAEWLQDEWYAAMEKDGSYTKSRMRKGLVNMRMSSILRMIEKDQAPVDYYNCAAGFGGLGIGPTGELSSCHHRAAVGDTNYRFDTVTARGLWEKMARETQHMNNSVCATCCSKYTCGGICYTSLNNSTCEAFRANLELALFVLANHLPDKAQRVSDVTRAAAEKSKKLVAQMRQLLESEHWDNLIRAKLSADEMGDLIAQFRGFMPKLDVPIWELPAPGSPQSL